MKRVSVVACVVAAAVGCNPPKPAGPVQSIDSFVVQPPMASYFGELDRREQKEQVRDWAVLGTVAHLGATPEQAAKATYEIPPGRLPYLDELYSFEHGRGRRLYLGERVLLFRDAEDPAPQATIGRLADRVRMENGEVPPVVEVYVVHDVRDEGTIRIDRQPDVSRQELFSSAYGYVEAEAKDPAAIGEWLASADDLTFAQMTPEGGLRLGGRRFAGKRTANITLEDVAALYQAHEELDRPKAEARKLFATLPGEAKAAAERVVELVRARAAREEFEEPLRVISMHAPRFEPDEFWKAIFELVPEQSPGFSLDWEWLPDPANPRSPAMLERIRAFAADPCRNLKGIGDRADALEVDEPDETRRTALAQEAVMTRAGVGYLTASHSLADACAIIRRDIAPGLLRVADEIAQASPADWDKALAGYHDVLQQAMSRSNQQERTPVALAKHALSFHHADTAVQCARYSGLEGTRVGMTLFYTDLIAKLWQGTDYGMSAPVVEVPGFPAMPLLNLPEVFRKEPNIDSSTRLWFGPRAAAVSRKGASDDAAFLFDHRFTRIYAAGSNPARPEEESRPAEDSRRAFGWWDQHYDEVADHEHEYHRLNQITKWSLVTAALADSPMGARLREQRVRRDFTFLTWQRANRSQLRFSEELPAVKTPLAGRECVPLLTSYSFESMGGYRYITGGVSTSPRSAPKQVPVIEPKAGLGARRPHVDDLGAGKNGTATRARPTVEEGAVTFVNAEKAQTKSLAGPIDLGTPRVQIGRGDSPGSLAIRAGSPDRPIGTLQMGGRSKRVELEWADGVVEQQRRGVTQVGAVDRAAADRLAANGNVVDAARAYRTLVPAKAETADDLARAAVMDAARRNPAAVLRTVQKLEGRGAQLSPELQQAVANAVSEVGSDSVMKHVTLALRTRQPLKSADGELKVERGKVILTRDIDELPAAKMSRQAPSDLSKAEVYLEDRMLAAREGHVADSGGHVSRLRNRPNITMAAMDGNELGGVLPDKIVERNAGRTWHRAEHASPAGDRLAGNGSRPIVFVRHNYQAPSEPSCDAEKRTPVTSDDCAEQR